MSFLSSYISRVSNPPAWLLAAILLPSTAAAIDGEIHVYDDEVLEPGTLNLTINNNYIARGANTADYPGAVVPGGSLSGGTEWAYGVRPGVELGLFLPIASIANHGRITLDGAELRLLLLPPSLANGQGGHFFYGLNTSLGINNRAIDEKPFDGEIQPILGARWGAFTLTLNPSLETGFNGPSNLVFAPTGRLAYEYSKSWTFAVENHADLGQLTHLSPAPETSQRLFAVAQYNTEGKSIEAGVGQGLTHASDQLTVRLVVSFDIH